MNNLIFQLLMAAPQGAEGAPAGNPLMSFLPFIIIIAIFYFLIIRPQNKKRKETERMLSSIKKGDKIVTIGGLYGTITSVKERTVIIKADDNVKLEFLRSAISSVEQPAKEKEDKNDDNNDSKTEDESSSSNEE